MPEKKEEPGRHHKPVEGREPITIRMDATELEHLDYFRERLAEMTGTGTLPTRSEGIRRAVLLATVASIAESVAREMNRSGDGRLIRRGLGLWRDCVECNIQPLGVLSTVQHVAERMTTIKKEGAK